MNYFKSNMPNMNSFMTVLCHTLSSQKITIEKNKNKWVLYNMWYHWYVYKKMATNLQMLIMAWMYQLIQQLFRQWKVVLESLRETPWEPPKPAQYIPVKKSWKSTIYFSSYIWIMDPVVQTHQEVRKFFSFYYYAWNSVVRLEFQIDVPVWKSQACWLH